MTDVRMIVGGQIDDDAAAFVDAWHRAEHGSPGRDRTIAFESWEALTKIMTGDRYRLLKHVHAQPEPSISALARSLGRQYRRVHADVAVLEAAGLVARRDGALHAVFDTLKADLRL